MATVVVFSVSLFFRIVSSLFVPLSRVFSWFLNVYFVMFVALVNVLALWKHTVYFIFSFSVSASIEFSGVLRFLRFLCVNVAVSMQGYFC